MDSSGSTYFHALRDAFARRFDDITVDMVIKLCIDDSIHWNDKTETAFWHILEYISHCSKNSIVFNTELFHFGEVVESAGFWITKDGVKLRFHQFPTHTNITSVRYWHRLVNQVSYAFTQAEIMVSFRELLC